MNNPLNWIKAHPYQAVTFTGYFTLIGSFAGFLPHLWVPFLVLFLVGVVVFVLLFQLYKPLMFFLLAFLMMMSPGHPPVAKASQKEGGEVVITVIVICGATYCIYKLARFCKQHFPPPNTNQVNEVEMNFGAGGGGTNYAASFAISDAPCSTGTPTTGTNYVLPTSFTINAAVRNGALRTAVSASGETASMETFLAEVQAQGLTPVGESYSVNGVSAPPSSVPISYTPSGGISNGIAGTTYTISVQASSDMQNWQTLFTTTASEGTAFQVQDTVTSVAMFYRLELR